MGYNILLHISETQWGFHTLKKGCDALTKGSCSNEYLNKSDVSVEKKTSWMLLNALLQL